MKYGNWEVIGEERKKNKRGWAVVFCKCVCSCGKIATIHKGNLTSGKSTSCRKCSLGQKKHGLYKHELYAIWTAMKQRCTNKNHPSFHNYGGRGIEVCKEWERDFEKFYSWAKPLWKKGLQLDREDNDRGYSPENCRFITQAENLLNSRLLSSNNSSGYRGVKKVESTGNYVAAITFKKKEYRVGTFSNIVAAAVARDRRVLDLELPLPLNFADGFPDIDPEKYRITRKSRR